MMFSTVLFSSPNEKFSLKIHQTKFKQTEQIHIIYLFRSLHVTWFSLSIVIDKVVIITVDAMVVFFFFLILHMAVTFKLKR